MHISPATLPSWGKGACWFHPSDALRKPEAGQVRGILGRAARSRPGHLRVDHGSPGEHSRGTDDFRTESPGEDLEAMQDRNAAHSGRRLWTAKESFKVSGSSPSVWCAPRLLRQLGNLRTIDDPQRGAVGLSAHHLHPHSGVVGRARRGQCQVLEPYGGQRSFQAKLHPCVDHLLVDRLDGLSA